MRYLKQMKEKNILDIYEYNGNEEVLTVPSKIDGITVCSMGSIVFYNNETLREVTLPKTIVTVSQGVFKTAYALEKISIENPTEAGFHTTDGVFFNGKQLVAYPPAKTGRFLCYSRRNNRHIERGFLWMC